MTVPNLITSIRILLTPIFIIYLINDNIFSALLLFILAGVSDALDGFIARVFNQKSRLGAILDPLADKILLTSAFVVLPLKGYFDPWLSVIVISRDILIMLGVLILFLNSQKFFIKPTFISKITTFLQLMTVFFVLLSEHLGTFQQMKAPMFWATGLLTIISGLHYMRHWFGIMGEGPLHDGK